MYTIEKIPTAINLKWAVDRMLNKLSGIKSNEEKKEKEVYFFHKQ